MTMDGAFQTGSGVMVGMTAMMEVMRLRVVRACMSNVIIYCVCVLFICNYLLLLCMLSLFLPSIIVYLNCSHDRFPCEGGQKCITLSSLCNGREDCNDGIDERCGSCLYRSSLWCDGHEDCIDGSDEDATCGGMYFLYMLTQFM